MDFSVVARRLVFIPRFFQSSVLLLMLAALSTPVDATNNGSGYRHKNGYGHHDNHSGHYNHYKKRTRWKGPHKGCRVKGDHHHNDQQPGELNCLNAHADPDSLWPANHKFKTVRIEGLTTPSGDAPDISVQCITQDEPLNGHGDGNTDYDAKLLSGNKVKLRKERTGGGNGRVYHIDFLASDAVTGESCNGSVAVEVPHHKWGKAEDDGRLYTSVEGMDCTGNTNNDPEITSDPITVATETIAYQYAVIANDPDGDTLGYQLNQSPDGMTIDSDGVIDWLPLEGQAGSYTVVVSVDDGVGGNAQQSFTLIVDPRPNTAPVINSLPVLQGIEEQAYLYPVEASDADGDALTYRLLTAPVGMTINGEGLVQWAPSTGSAGDYTVSLQVTDTQDAAAEQTYTLTIAPKPNNAPSITSLPVVDGVEDSVYQYQVVASDPDGDALTYSLTDAPTGMTISGGLISWLPDFDSAGEYAVTVVVTDTQTAEASQSYTLTVANTNRDPVVNSTPIIETAEGQLYEYLLEASDPDGDALQTVLIEGPAGLTINTEGLVSWVVDYEAAGQHYINLEVNDGQGGSASQAYTLNVLPTNRDPIIVSAPVVNGQENILYEYAVEAIDDDDDALNYSLVTGPVGMNISAEGVVSWLPDFASAGEHAVEVAVSDGQVSISQQFIITVANGNRPPEITSAPSTTVTAGASYFYTVTAIDPDDDIVSYHLAEAPAGMTISVMTGEISWFPTNNDLGSHQVAAVATDEEGLTDTQALTVWVFPVAQNHAPQITTTPLLTLQEGQSYLYDVDAIDQDGDVLGYTLSNNPNGMSISLLTGEIIWQPEIPVQLGKHSVAVRVQDTNGAYTTQNYIVDVIGRANQPPQIVSTALTHVDENTLYSYQVEAEDPDGDAVVYRLVQAPADMTINPTSGLISWLANADNGTQVLVAVVADDQREGTDVQLFTIDIRTAADNAAPEFISQPILSVDENTLYAYSAVAVDPDGDELAYSATQKPEGLLVNPHTGDVNWSVDAAYVQSVDAENIACMLQPDQTDPLEPLEPTLKWHWNGAPELPNITYAYGPVAVAQLSDDDGNGVIDHHDIPDLVFTAKNRLTNLSTALFVVSGLDGETLWSTPSSEEVASVGSVAVGDIDGDGIVEIIVSNRDRTQLMAYENDLTPKWRKPHGPAFVGDSSGNRDAVSLADMDADGTPEIIIGRKVYDNNGNLIWEGANDNGGQGNFGTISIPADVNLDGKLELVAGRSLYSFDQGVTLWHKGEIPSGGFNAIGNFDDDDYPEIVLVASGMVYLLEHTGEYIWDAPVAIPGGGVGGPPTVSDLDNDGEPEISVAGAQSYVVIETDGAIKWQQSIEDESSSRTGSSVFDFEGDGRVEILYADEQHFYIYDGLTGAERFKIPSRSGTTLELPVIADVDSDGHADIVFAANNSDDPLNDGVRVYSNLNWLPTRSIWNQHAYSIDNVNDDGSIPAVPEKSWLSHNTFRLNTFPDRSPLALPDLRAGDIYYDTDNNNLTVTVSNIGLAPTLGSTDVLFYNGDPDDGGTLLGVVAIDTLASDDQLAVTLPVASGVVTDDIVVRINEFQSLEECQYENNQSRAALIGINATDPAGLSDSQTYLLNVHNVNEPPLFATSIPSVEIYSGQDFNHQVEVVDADLGDSIVYSLVSAPDGIELNATDGSISWTPGAGQAGDYIITLRATDLGGLYVEQSFTISVVENRAPVIVSDPVTSLLLDPAIGEGEPVDLQAWTAVEVGVGGSQQSEAEWVVSSDNTQVEQLVNADPSAFVSDFILENAQMHGQWYVNTSVDDDFMGFVFGYQNPYQYYVFQWKQNAQSNSELGTARRGMQLRVYNLNPDGSEGKPILWDSNNHNGTILYENTEVSWQPFVIYDFELTFNAGEMTITVKDGETVVDSFTVQDNTFTTGNFGFFNHSQGNLIYRGFTRENLAGRTYQYDTEATDADGDTLVYALSSAPDDMSIDSETGLVTWLVDTDDVGAHDISVTATDPAGAYDIQHYTLEIVDQVPVITSAAPLTAHVGYNYAYDVDAVDPNPEDALSYSLVSAPANMEIAEVTGLISWLPTQDDVGDQTVLVRVTDPQGNFNEQAYVLTVVDVPPNTPPVFTSTPPLSIVIGNTYSYTPTTFDEDGDSVQVNLVSVPEGMQMWDGQTITWSPSLDQVGEHEVILSADDARFGSVQQSYVVKVLFGANSSDSHPPQITSTPIYSVNPGVLYQYAVIAIDQDGDELVYQLQAAPDGMAMDSAGVISWSSPELGSHYVQIKVSDPSGASTQQGFTLSVVDNLPPHFSSLPPTLTSAGQAYQYNVVVVDPEGSGVSYQLLQAPLGMLIDSSSGLLSWTPSTSQLGIHSITISATDGDNANQQSFNLLVVENAAPIVISEPPTHAVVGELYQYAIIAEDREGEPLNYQLLGAPAGVSIDAAGLVSWQSGLMEAGSYVISIRISDPQGASTLHEFTVFVAADQASPIITSDAITKAKTELGYQYPLMAIDPDGDTLNYQVINGPPGMAIDDSGLVTWSPTTADIGTHHIHITVSDEQGHSAEQQYDLSVTAPGPWGRRQCR